MGLVRVEDVVLWIKHIDGDDELRDRLMRLPENSVVPLEVGGRRGLWLKMRDGGAAKIPTNGLKPQGDIKTFWTDLYTRYKPSGGIVVGITDASDAHMPTQADLPASRAIEEVVVERPTAESKERARLELQHLRNLGWSSDGRPYGTRDEWYSEDGI